MKYNMCVNVKVKQLGLRIDWKNFMNLNSLLKCLI